MSPGTHHSGVLQRDPDTDDVDHRGGSVDSIDTLSSSADHGITTASTETTSDTGGKDQR